MKTQLLMLFLSTALAFATNEDIEKFVQDTLLFTGAVYNEVLLNNNDNFLVSPFSAETVLALTQSGAVGITGKELRASLFLPDTKEDTETIFKSVLPSLHSDQFVLTTANKIYVEEGLTIKKNFEEVAKSVYEAEFQSIQFENSVAAADEINHWVEKETREKIHNVVNADDLNEGTKVLLINALYFQGNWTLPFATAFTQAVKFFKPNEVVSREMMFAESQPLNFYESKELDAKFLELPIQGGASLTIVLPNKNEGLGVLEKQISRVFSEPKYSKEFVQVVLPKFKIEASIDFAQILEDLGVHAAFSNQADFSGMAGNPGELCISKVLQKTFIDVNEMGVEAAAATVVIVGPTAVTRDPTQFFIADHPFIFYLKVKDIILFEGRVLDPVY